MSPGEVYYFSANSYVLCVKSAQPSAQEPAPLPAPQGQAASAAVPAAQVTPKTPGLNPNANVFHSKSPSTPPEPVTELGTEWTPESPPVDDLNNLLTPTHSPGPGFTYMNGDGETVEGDGETEDAADVDDSKVPGGINFPLTPESPLQITDYQNLNGGATSPNDTSAFSQSSDTDENAILDGNVPDDQLRVMLKSQLEYYFSRENLANDSYLVSQMDADQYVPISTVANFNQVKRLTNDVQLVVEVLRDSVNVQVDDKGEKVRPLHKRCVVILREVPEVTPVEEVEKLFSGDNCPKFVSCEFAHNSNWYVTFACDEDAQRAYQYLREEVKTFQGKPIMARIKAKPLLHSTFVPKNGFKAQGGPSFAGSTDPTTAGFNQQRYTTYTQVPSSTQYIIGQQVTTQQNYPFFPPSTVVHPWTAGPMPYFDPGTIMDKQVSSYVNMVFAANGYTPTAAYKLNTASNRHSGAYQNTRNRNQNSKPAYPHRPQSKSHSRSGVQNNLDRNNDVRSERHSNPTNIPPRLAAARANEMAHSRVQRNDSNHPHNSMPAVSSSSTTQSSTISTSSQPHSTHSTPSAVTPAPDSSPNSVTSSHRQSDSSLKESSQPPRRPGYRSRRRREDDTGSSKNQRNTSGAPPAVTKDSSKLPGETPRFELEATSFPPLPGSTSAPSPKTTSQSSENVFENKMSDVVKGTAKPSTRETKAAPPAPLTIPPSPDKNANTAAPSLPTPPPSPDKLTPKTTATTTTTTPPTTRSETPPAQPTPASKPTVAPTTTSKPEVQSPTTKPAPAKAAQTTVAPQPVKESSIPKQTSPAVDAGPRPVTPPLVDDPSGPPKLSYAQMVQRTKEREAREAGDKSESKDGASSCDEATSPKPQAPLREQSQTAASRAGTSRPADIRKDEPREQRIGRRAKENRRSDPPARQERERFPRLERRAGRDVVEPPRPAAAANAK